MISSDENVQDEEVADVWVNNEAVRKAIHADSVRFLNFLVESILICKRTN